MGNRHVHTRDDMLLSAATSIVSATIHTVPMRLVMEHLLPASGAIDVMADNIHAGLAHSLLFIKLQPGIMKSGDLLMKYVTLDLFTRKIPVGPVLVNGQKVGLEGDGEFVMLNLNFHAKVFRFVGNVAVLAEEFIQRFANLARV